MSKIFNANTVRHTVPQLYFNASLLTYSSAFLQLRVQVKSGEAKNHIRVLQEDRQKTLRACKMVRSGGVSW